MPSSPPAVSDPTDWTNTSLPLLSAVESGLRCEICKDFYSAPVITACNHTFCSGCIRRSGSAVNASRKCPLCWAGFDEGQLRKNMVVEEVVRAFVDARASLLDVARWKSEREERERTGGAVAATRKRKIDEIGLDHENGVNGNGPSPRKTRSQTQRRSGPVARVVADSVEPEEEVSEVEREDRQPDDEYQIDDGKVPCPICQQRMPEAQVFTHLDTHSDDKPVAATAPTFGLPNRAQNKTPTMTPLPTLSYSLLSDMQLRKKLRELGIPETGNKQTMSRRHTEWRNLVNSNCDSSRPRSKPELLKELQQWERTQNSSNHATAVKSLKNSVMEKDFDRDHWSANHGSDFQSLIAAARAKVKAKTQADPVKPSETSEQSSAVNGEVAEPPQDQLPAERFPSPHKIPPSSQMEVVNLVSPDKIQKVNGFSVP